jgi:uncharacterized membrane protein (UPF0127 family)
MPPRHVKNTLLVCAVLALGATGAVLGQSAPLEDLSAFPQTELTIQHRGPPAATHRFDVWIANSSDRQEQGLMFVRDLPQGRGMIFPEDPPRTMNMWMKNTYVELDMVFVSASGRISKIIQHAQPLSETTLSSDDPVAAVLEIGGGEASRLGLAVGDRLAWAVSK